MDSFLLGFSKSESLRRIIEENHDEDHQEALGLVLIIINNSNHDSWIYEWVPANFNQFSFYCFSAQRISSWKGFFYLDLNCPPEITVNKREDKKHNKDNKYEKQSMFQECTLILK